MQVMGADFGGVPQGRWLALSRINGWNTRFSSLLPLRRQMSFKVDPRGKKKVLSNIATSCRTFRKALTTYIRKHKSDPDILARPPPNYSFLDQNQWDAFVKHRLTKDFQKLSDENRERQSKNIYPCRLSRKGYAVLEQEQFNGKTTYTKAEIDEVRVEWMNCVLEYDI